MTSPPTHPAERETPPGEAMREAVARDYVLVKRGVYYMPNANGYTGVLDEAGRYTEAEAKAQTGHCDGVTAILASEAPRFSQACWQETITKVLHADLAKAASELARLTAERDKLQRAVDAYRSPPRLYTLADMQGSIDRADAAEERASAAEAALTTQRADHAAEVARLKERGKTLRCAVKVAKLRFEAIGDAAPEAARRLAAIGDADCAAALATTETTNA